jgi:tetratricopeptide (TPR) repeat protein
MADRQPSGPRRSEALSGADDDARIENLLVTGLDHYFAGEFEAAISLWTRVLFVDRNHDRARAYIDRARSAQAEQQRISEALVHEGLEAFDKGEVARARALLSDALDQGASHDVALGVLGRIDRLDAGSRNATPAAPPVRRRPQPRPQPAPDMNRRHGRLALWWVTAASIVLVGAVSFVLVAPNGLADWFPVQATTGARAAIIAPPSILPLPSPTEAFMVQARALFVGGKLRDALRALDRVPVGDALRPDADRLRADIQRELLAVADAEASSASAVTPVVVAPKE